MLAVVRPNVDAGCCPAREDANDTLRRSHTIDRERPMPAAVFQRVRAEKRLLPRPTVVAGDQNPHSLFGTHSKNRFFAARSELCSVGYVRTDRSVLLLGVSRRCDSQDHEGQQALLDELGHESFSLRQGGVFVLPMSQAAVVESRSQRVSDFSALEGNFVVGTAIVM